jgi:two-component system sensor histidine kinase KdpD
LDDERKAEILSDIEQESERLFRLIEDLLALARLELGASVALRPVLFQRVLEKTLVNFARRRPSRQIENRTPDDLPAVQADATYVEQIMRNLLGNADKYSPTNEPISISTEARDEDVMIRVLDRGPGLSEGEIERIFDRFYRAEKTARQAGGLGIGLTVCRRLVEAQGGGIWAEPREGGGLTMAFTIPIATGEPDD